MRRVLGEPMRRTPQLIGERRTSVELEEKGAECSWPFDETRLPRRVETDFPQ